MISNCIYISYHIIIVIIILLIIIIIYIYTVGLSCCQRSLKGNEPWADSIRRHSVSCWEPVWQRRQNLSCSAMASWAARGAGAPPEELGAPWGWWRFPRWTQRHNVVILVRSYRSWFPLKILRKQLFFLGHCYSCSPQSTVHLTSFNSTDLGGCAGKLSSTWCHKTLHVDLCCDWISLVMVKKIRGCSKLHSQ